MFFDAVLPHFYRVMKRLNGRERTVATIAADLFLKGTPEWRTAKYGFERGFTAIQFDNFLEKLPLPEEVKNIILTHFKDLSRGQCFDKAKVHGGALSDWLERNKA